METAYPKGLERQRWFTSRRGHCMLTCAQGALVVLNVIKLGHNKDRCQPQWPSTLVQGYLRSSGVEKTDIGVCPSPVSTAFLREGASIFQGAAVIIFVWSHDSHKVYQTVWHDYKQHVLSTIHEKLALQWTFWSKTWICIAWYIAKMKRDTNLEQEKQVHQCLVESVKVYWMRRALEDRHGLLMCRSSQINRIRLKQEQRVQRISQAEFFMTDSRRR